MSNTKCYRTSKDGQMQWQIQKSQKEEPACRYEDKWMSDQKATPYQVRLYSYQTYPHNTGAALCQDQ